MPDLSHLDDKYFVNRDKYNCPYCRRRHVSFSVSDMSRFDWAEQKKCYAIFVKCDSCSNVSMHLTYHAIATYSGGYSFNTDEIDDKLFYSVPTSVFAIDNRIPKALRELVSEAEGCLKSNYLTGASACARKVVYELAVGAGAEGDNYEDRIKSLKAKLPTVDPTYFDTLLTIQQLTSEKVHENSYDGWDAKHLKVILAALYEVLQEIFVIPKIREEKRKAIVDLKSAITGGKTEKPEAEGAA